VERNFVEIGPTPNIIVVADYEPDFTGEFAAVPAVE
jgi:hypothetical protein